MTKDEILFAIQEVVAHAGGEWPDTAGEPEVLRRVKMLARMAASHGQAPAPTHEQIAAYLESTGAYVTNDATREAAIAEAIDTDRAKRGQAPDLHPKTSDLVQRFAAALAEKLSAAEKKYGYSDGWASPNWMDECRQHLSAHIAKGDPRDVAAYCAFLWHHGATTASPQAEQQAPTGSEIYVCARKCYNCGHAGINDDHADNAACKSCDWSGPSPEKDHCPDCEKDGTMTAACPMCSCAYIMVADTQVAAPAAPAQSAAQPSRDLAAVIKGAADKLDAAVCCHPNAVDTLIHEALEILDGDREPDGYPEQPVAQHYGPLRDADAEHCKQLSVYSTLPPTADTQQAPAGATLPDGWVPLTITHEGQYPEEVAYGPQIMMDRLDKWLGKYFAQADSVPAHQLDTGYPPLPTPNIQRGGFPNLFTEGQLRAYVDADRAARKQGANHD